MKPPIAGLRRGRGGWMLLPLCLAACSGTTQAIQSRDIRMQPRPSAAVSYALGEVTVISRVPTFDTDYERANYARSLKTILEHANLFGEDASKPYRLSVSIEGFSIPHASFAGFNSTLDVRYELRDATGSVVYQGLVQSAGADDTGSGLGPVRQDRSRTRAVAENLASFVKELAPKLERHARATAPAPPTAAPLASAPSGRAAPAELPAVDVSGQPAAGGQLRSLPRADHRQRSLPTYPAAAQRRPRRPPAGSDPPRRLRLRDQLARERHSGPDPGGAHGIPPETGAGGQPRRLLWGHGWVDKDEDEGYWLPVDAQADDPVRWLSNSTLTSTIRAMRAKHILIIADSCFAGKLTRGINPSIRTHDYLTRMAAKQARTALTSGGLEPVLDSGGKEGHSVFATALFKALAANEAVIDMSQMFSFIRREVALHAQQFPEYGDIRQAGHDGGDFLFVREPRK